jgi:hypothetical protein
MTTREISLGYDPRLWQRECHLALRRFSVLALHRRAGKTVLSIAELVDKALTLKRTVPEGRFGYIAPFLKQAKNIAWAKLKQRVAPLVAAGACKVSESDLTVTFAHNGARITLFGADNADAIRGDYLDGVVMDEVAQMDPEVWYEIVRPMLADYHGWALFIGTPNGVNLFSELYRRAKAMGGPAWFAKSYTVYETNALDPAEVESMRSDMSPEAFERELLCSFDVPGASQLIAPRLVSDAMTRHLRPDEYKHAPRIIGVDPARFGDDRSVIIGRQGLKVEEPIILPGVDNATLVDRIIDYKHKFRADAIFVDAGQGAGVVDWLRRLGHECTEIWFGGKATDAHYHDKRTEIWCRMADAMPMLSLPPHEGLRLDLVGPMYEYNATTGKKRLESKDKMKERILMSPDIGDALALTWAQPVEVKTQQQQALEALSVSQQGTVPEYDPFRA